MDEILDLIESVSENFPTCFRMEMYAFEIVILGGESASVLWSRNASPQNKDLHLPPSITHLKIAFSNYMLVE